MTDGAGGAPPRRRRGRRRSRDRDPRPGQRADQFADPVEIGTGSVDRARDVGGWPAHRTGRRRVVTWLRCAHARIPPVQVANRREARQPQGDDQRQTVQPADEQHHAVPAGMGEEPAAGGAEDRRAQIVKAEIDRGGLRPVPQCAPPDPAARHRMGPEEADRRDHDAGDDQQDVADEGHQDAGEADARGEPQHLVAARSGSPFAGDADSPCRRHTPTKIRPITVWLNE